MVFIATQLVAGDLDSDESSSSPSSPSTSSIPLQARSPLRNATLVAVQNALSKHTQQVQVSTAPLLVTDVNKMKILLYNSNIITKTYVKVCILQ